MATIIKLNGTKEEVQPKNGNIFRLDELQGFVNGYIEIVPINSGEYEGKLMIVDEEGKIKVGAEVNFEASQIANQAIVGTVLIIDKDQIE
jgi:hypothetical protein